MNTTDTDYDNPTEHVAQETTCFEFETQYDKISTQRAANDPNDTHRIAATTKNTVHTLSKKMWAMDSDDQHDGGHRYKAMTTNLSESFNGFLKSARNLPITALVKLTDHHCVAYFADRYTNALAEVIAGELITAYAKNKFNKWEKKKAPKYSITVFSHEDGLFEVRTPINPNFAYRGNHRHEVNLRQSTCSCQKWQVYKIPCSHVIAMCKYQGISAM